MSGRAGIVEYGIDHFNDYCRTLVQRTTDAWERYVTRQARWVDFANDYKTMDLSYMESVMWAFKTPVGEGSPLRGRAGPPLLLGVRDPAVELRDPPGRRLPAPPGPGRHCRLHARRRRQRHRPRRFLGPAATPGVDDDARGRCRRTWPWPSGPDIDVRRLRAPRQPDRDRRRTRRRLPRALRRRRAAGPVHRPEPWSDGRYRPLFPFFADWPGAFRGARRGLRRHRRRHRRGPHGPGLRRGGLRPLRRGGHRAWCAPSTTGPASPPRSRPTPVSSCSTPTAPSSPTSRRRAPWWRPSPTPTAIPTAGAPTRPSSTRPCSSWFVPGHRHQGPHARAQPADRLGPRPHPRRRLRQVARRGARLVDQPQPLLGVAHPGVEERRPDAIPASTSTAASRSSSATSASASRTCTVPPSTRSSGPIPTTPPGARPCDG